MTFSTTEIPASPNVVHMDPAGLNAAQVALHLQQDGPNVLPSDRQRGWRAIVAETLSDPMFALLLGAGVLYFLLGDLQEGLILMGLVLVVLALTLYQEGKTEHALAALRDLTSPRALVVRDGQPVRIAGRDVVRDDILLLAEGDRVAADALLIRGTEVQVDESLLTGEPHPVDKVAMSTVASSDDNASKSVKSTLFSGTLLVRGQAMARVVATGVHSEIGRIGAALDSLTAEPSPLRRQTTQLVRVLAVLAVVASVMLVVAFGWQRGDWLGALLAGIALAMALLPQEFSVVLTVIPALGAWRLSKHQVLTRRIAAIETLGATSVLCVDKTGTLTENRMTVARLYAESPASSGTAQPDGAVQGCSMAIDYATTTELPETFHTLVEFSILASVSDPFDPMEKAFHRLGQHFLQDTEHLHRDWTLLQQYGLTPELRAMSHVWKAVDGSAHVVAAKGAPEAIADLCHMDAAALARVAAAVDDMAAQGLRVLGVAQARFEGEAWPAIEHDFEFEFVGLLGLADPLRAEIPEAVAQAHAAGIRVVMITGDYPATATAIARQAKLHRDLQAAHDATDTEPWLLTGETLAQLDDVQLQQRMATVTVCARIAPTQKLRIVQALKANGEVVAMTGDGVNDAPALKAAHVGVAMGERGTDVAREAASVVLLNDNFAALVHAVRLGRRIFDNLRKSMSYILAVHVPIAGMALLPVLLGWPTMLFPLHIAFLELVIDPACSMVFENEPDEPGLMQRQPRNVNTPLLGGKPLVWALAQGLGSLALVLSATWWGLNHLSEGATRAFAFAMLVAGNLALILANRARRGSLLQSLQVPNRTLWLVCAAAMVLLGLSLYVPWLAGLFKFAYLPWPWLGGALALGVLLMLVLEALKPRAVDAGGAPCRG